VLVVVAPIVVFALIVGVIVLVLRPRPAAAPVAHLDPPGMRTVASIRAAEKTALGEALRDALIAEGAAVAELDHDYALELDVTLRGLSFGVSVGFVGDDDAPWKVFVDDLRDDDASREALRVVHAALGRIEGADRVRWASRQSEARGAAEWKSAPLDA
jgi:hypothetical protein